MTESFRIEHDTMGEVRVPAGALYGAQTQRAVENFPISRMRLGRVFLNALGLVKFAAARANQQAGTLPSPVAGAIETAAQEVMDGRHDSQFVVDVFQTGSGTSTNMNANEVIATRATAILGQPVHPNDHVNRSQSSNDVFPTALHIAAARTAQQTLLPAMDALRQALDTKRQQFWGILKIGRTHLQDAVPIRLGQEFGGYARQVELSQSRIRKALEDLYELPLGGTAVGIRAERGAGIRPRPRSPSSPIEPGCPSAKPQNHFEAQAARDAVVFSAERSKLRDRADQNCQRHSMAGIRTALRTRRASVTRSAAGIEHHAGQGESGDRRERADGVRTGDRPRRDDQLGRVPPAHSS